MGQAEEVWAELVWLADCLFDWPSAAESGVRSAIITPGEVVMV